ncbi:MAG TPA: type II toxin-antitoxin system VapC family toxin, partial [Lacipirellulaceae bacterium]|nr:type II toxin-antitoxin system VapC family toxin [Lacipirellulaceae bacterium]
LVKLYVQEEGTETMLELAHPDSGNRLVILSLSRIEFRAAVRRRAKLGDLDTELANELINEFNGHVSTVFQLQPINEPAMDAAAAAIDSYYLRAYDAMQFGGYIALRNSVNEAVEIVFVCADNQLLKAAHDQDFPIVNPATE